MTGVVRLGDVSDHGGTIISASSTVTANGRVLALIGDLHSCPIEGHGVTPMQSSSTVTNTGRGLVRMFIDHAGCGAVIVTGDQTIEVVT